MPRVKTGTSRRRRHKKVLNLTKGYRLARSKHYKVAHESLLHAGQHAYIGRKNKKRDFRRLWIMRINAGLAQTENGPSYSVFMKLLKDQHIDLNRKMLAELAVADQEAFSQLVTRVYGK